MRRRMHGSCRGWWTESPGTTTQLALGTRVAQRVSRHRDETRRSWIIAVIRETLAAIASSAIHRSPLPHVRHLQDAAAASRIDRLSCTAMPITNRTEVSSGSGQLGSKRSE